MAVSQRGQLYSYLKLLAWFVLLKALRCAHVMLRAEVRAADIRACDG